MPGSSVAIIPPHSTASCPQPADGGLGFSKVISGAAYDSNPGLRYHTHLLPPAKMSYDGGILEVL